MRKLLKTKPKWTDELNMRSHKIWMTGACFLLAFLLLSICSRSSFLYPCNDWNDANSYFTMGKALMNGQIIYRDLYDQKGPYLYLIYGLSYLLSHDSFAGVFVMEILAAGFFLLSACKTLELFCKRRTAALLLPVFGAVIFASKSFYWGGAAEEFCLPLLGFGLYFSLKYFKERYPEPMDGRTVLLNGIFAGILMQVKYTMLGFYIAFMGMIVLTYILRKRWKEMLQACLIFLGGILATLVPWLIFFGINGALDDWYQCYVYNNVFLYSNLDQPGGGIGSRIYTLAKLLYWLILDNLSYFSFIIIGIAGGILSRGSRWVEKINILALFGLTFLGIYVGGSNLPYYAIPLTCFAVLGFGVIGRLLDGLARKAASAGEKHTGEAASAGKRRSDGRWLWGAALVCLTVGSMAGAYAGSMNSYFMKQDRDSYFLYQFKEIIQQEEAPTLLNIGCLDAGLYTVADVMPTCKYFQTNGIALEEMFREQERYVAEGQTQFVLARDEYPETIWENYELAAEAPYEWDGMTFTYYLFRKK